MAIHVEVDRVSIGGPSKDREILDRLCQIAGHEERYVADVLRFVVRLGFQAMDRGHWLTCPGPGCSCARSIESDETGVVVAFPAPSA